MPARAKMALVGVAALTMLLFLTWLVAFHIGFVEHADRSALRGFAGLGKKPHVWSLAAQITRLCDPNPYVYLCAVPVVVALARGRWWVAVAIIAILLGANVTTQLLKPLIAVQRPHMLPGPQHVPALNSSWPSGHATAAMSLALCCVLAVPARLRPFVAALGAAFAVVVSYSILALEWHYPSDVLGGFLVAGIWTLLGVAAVFTVDPRRSAVAAAPSGVPAVPSGATAAPSGVPAPASRVPAAASGTTPRRQPRLSLGEALAPPSAALLAALLLALIVVIARPHEVVAYVRLHETFVVGAAAIGAMGLALATGVMLALRR